MNEISLLRFIATILITNSHFGHLYPNNISFLATGGTIGNSIFFFASGYALYFSNKESFRNWITKRFLKIYIPVWIFNIAILLLTKQWSLTNNIIPNYWFLKAILIFYLAYYFIVRYLENKLWIVIISLTTLYIFVFNFNDNNSFIIENTENPTKLHWFYYFAIMIFGTIMAKNGFKSNKNIMTIFIFFILVIISYYSLKFLTIYFHVFFLQIFIPFFLFLFCYFSFEFISKLNKYKGLNNKFLIGVSNQTLEIYIVQFATIRFLTNVIFPLNMIACLISILIFAFILKQISNSILKLFIVK